HDCAGGGRFGEPEFVKWLDLDGIVYRGVAARLTQRLRQVDRTRNIQLAGLSEGTYETVLIRHGRQYQCGRIRAAAILLSNRPIDQIIEAACRSGFDLLSVPTHDTKCRVVEDRLSLIDGRYVGEGVLLGGGVGRRLRSRCVPSGLSKVGEFSIVSLRRISCVGLALRL